ncbi:MAG: Uma2 family endonuclease [Cyanobacteria bacterium P01_D01_bin.105]
MTTTSVRYKDYLTYLHSDLDADGDYRLLSNGEVIELPPEDDENYFIADEFAEKLKRVLKQRKLVRTNSTELQVHPIGDDCVNRKPDLIVLRPEHLDLMAELKKSAVLLGMPPPLFVAEVVSQGSERTDNYRRDYEWKKAQYEWWQIPEYWIVDRHRQQVVVFTLQEGRYSEEVYRDESVVKSSVFPALNLSANSLLAGEII